MAPILSTVEKKHEDIEICKELQVRKEDIINDRSDQFPDSTDYDDLEGRHWLGTHYINGALAMLRFVFTQ